MTSTNDSISSLASLRPNALPTLGSANERERVRKSLRACSECNRKKTKCNMTLPACYSCTRFGLSCTYPAGRKKRIAHQNVPERRKSLHQEIRNNFNSLSQLLDHDQEPNAGHNEGSRTSSPELQPPEPLANISPRAVVSEQLNTGILPIVPMLPELYQHWPNGIPDLQTGLSSPKSGVLSDVQGSSPKYLAMCSFSKDTSTDGRPGDNTTTTTKPTMATSEWFSLTSEYFQPWPGGFLDEPYQNAGIQWQALDTAAELHVSPQISPDNSPMAGVPPEIIEELVSIYFQKVHPFVPILHKPQFTARYLSDPSSILQGRSLPDLPAALLLTCVLALSARFSNSGCFNNLAPVDKGESFAKAAKLLYLECHSSLQVLTLEYLQACTLLAFYLYLSGPDSQGWMLIGMCTRLAYDLHIDAMDIDDDIDIPLAIPPGENAALKWRRQEETRRVWWSIWELDTFASAIVCRPHTIDRKTMGVKLPVSDEAWFSDSPIESALIDPDPQNAWHTLSDCPNQDPRAWFLLLNYLLLVAHDLGQLRKPNAQDIDAIDKAVTCYNLLLPPSFHIEANPESLSFNNNDFPHSNWIISTKIMFQGVRIFIKFLREKTSKLKVTASNHSLIAPLAGLESQFRAKTTNYYSFADTVFRILQCWPPTYIPYNSPFIGCLILGPAAMHLRAAIDRNKLGPNGGVSSSTDVEMLKLVLGHIGRYWKIGSILLEIATSVEASQASQQE